MRASSQDWGDACDRAFLAYQWAVYRGHAWPTGYLRRVNATAIIAARRERVNRNRKARFLSIVLGSVRVTCSNTISCARRGVQ